MLRAEYGRAEVEHVLSGPGLLNLHRFTHADGTCSGIREVAAERPSGGHFAKRPWRRAARPARRR